MSTEDNKGNNTIQLGKKHVIVVLHHIGIFDITVSQLKKHVRLELINLDFQLGNRITTILLHLKQPAVQPVLWWKGYAESSVE